MNKEQKAGKIQHQNPNRTHFFFPLVLASPSTSTDNSISVFTSNSTLTRIALLG